MKIKVSEATNAQLDWLVAKLVQSSIAYIDKASQQCWIDVSPVGHDVFMPTTLWHQGGLIIEREMHMLIRCRDGNGPVYWEAGTGFEGEPRHAIAFGPTPLIAAMRCYVVSKLGEEVEIPEALK